MMETKRDLLEILDNIKKYEGTDLELFSELMDAIRPTATQIKQKWIPNLDRVIQVLEKNESFKNGLSAYLHRIVRDKKLSSSLSDANIVTGLDFFAELKKRIVHKFLPYQPPSDTIEHVLVNVFYHPSDGDWIQLISDEKGEKIIALLGIQGLFERDKNSPFFQDILFAIRVITHRITGNAFDADILRMVRNHSDNLFPFSDLQNKVDSFLKIVSRAPSDLEIIESLKAVQRAIDECFQFIQLAYANKSLYGISFKTHQQLMLIEMLVSRLQLITGFIVKQENENSFQELFKLFKTLVQINSGKTEIRPYINRSTQLMAHEITQNTGKTGEHYITNSKEEYKQMLNSAIGGGAIVAFACVAKMELASVHTSLFGHGFLYALNYAIAFTAIYLLHYTLATKQPAMTAATLAQAIEQDTKDNTDFSSLAQLFGRLFRSQFIAFVGNVFMAFPVALALVSLWGFLFKVNLAVHKAPVFIRDLDFTQSSLIFHSAIAGVFLFVSGLISGIVHNRTKYLRIPDRIIQHPILKKVLSPQKLQYIANFYENNMGGISSNIWFGFFLGFTSTIGIIIGLNLDIRHITFAAGNFALGLYGHSFNLSWQSILMSIFGIGLIGFVNFIVSFSLSISLALRSRGIKFKALWQILLAIKKQFLLEPKSFFLPPR
ncbi:MAG: site-specific recombinase [Bacteroidia bacterium]|nr:site-specific recombinase [Bacteroidia bacterium]